MASSRDDAAASDAAMPLVEPQDSAQQTGQADQAGQAQKTQTPPPDPQEAAIAKVEQLLGVKDDTSRFVALALLKALLDDQVREAGKDGQAGEICSPRLLKLWDAIPVKFLDKLLRADLDAHSTPAVPRPGKGGADAAHMRDLAVAVLHTFAVRILPDDRRGDRRLVGRIPLLVASLLNTPSSSAPPSGANAGAESAATLILQSLATLVSRPEGAAVFNTSVTDLSPLTELAPEQPLVLEILLRAWLHGLLAATDSDATADVDAITNTINTTLPALAAAFKGTDGVTLLDFLARLLRNAEAFAEQQQQQRLLPAANPAWVAPAIGFIRRLAASRPTAASRAAYTHASAALLRAYPTVASTLLFGEGANAETAGGKASLREDKPFAYLLVSMLLVDLRATLPGLLAQLNNQDHYPANASRLASAFDILSAFIGYLVRSLDGDGEEQDELLTMSLTPDNLLRLRKSMSETLSVTAEHLRDRWDAAVAGAQGLHPDARTGTDDTRTHSLDTAGLPLAWDAAASETTVHRDPLVLAAVRALALWLREDDNDVLRREAAGLTGMFLDLYSSSGSADGGSLDFRRPVLVAFEGISASTPDGGRGGDAARDDDAYERDATALLLEHGAWKILTADLVTILQGPASAADAARGIEIVRVLLPIVEDERPGTQEAWMDVVTLVAAWAGPSDDDNDDVNNDGQPSHADTAVTATVAECRVAVLQLVTALVANAHPSVRRRYTHSIRAVIGLANQLRPTLAPSRIGSSLSTSLVEALDDVHATLEQ
ncbi:hypothetical protein HMPREF1624_07289 [Sporothrix schenckii ATCC 58251]|uniref:Neurochondrin-domain-containing protein n=1 Tax=Sporothrix schenckii (strain ATCC 58251 / de Perez 2211183) TaxID=1391915 RepID=U7PNU9_SPOS1|nr:hypothetical protein HMPREF1624_07289 [Sporothrix schenckii ATCC 58251]